MIEIKCAAPDTARMLCDRAAVTADTVMVMTERETLLGYACMSSSGEEVMLRYLEAQDVPLTDALLRASLNSARSAGAKTAVIVCESLLIHMRNKGYIPDSSETRVNIANFFAKSACKA